VRQFALRAYMPLWRLRGIEVRAYVLAVAFMDACGMATPLFVPITAMNIIMLRGPGSAGERQMDG